MNVFKCDCGQKLNINSKFCPECGKKLDYKERKLQIRILQFVSLLLVLFVLSASVLFFMIREDSKFKKDTPEFQSFVESFETVISFYPEIEQYAILDDYIALNSRNKGYIYQQNFASTIQTMAHNAGIIKPNRNIKVKYYYGNEFIREFY